MPLTSKRSVIVNLAGDLTFAQEFRAADVINSAANQIMFYTYPSGDTQINLAANAKSLTIIPQAGNTSLIKIKGVPGDTGIRIHSTDPTSIAFDATVAPAIFINLSQQTTLTLVVT